MKKLVLATVTAAALALPTATSSAQSLPAGGVGFARTVGTVRIDNHGHQALVGVYYSCSAGNHLWVSLKQSRSGRRDNRIKKEGSGGRKVAKAWLDSHREIAICDGRRRAAQFYVDQREPGKYGRLRRGYAWLQFCVTSGTNEADSKITTYLPKWIRVR
jgi:hypothetical protein